MNIKIGPGLPGLSTLLGVLFIAFKIAGIINWSWIWVLAPFWIYPIIYMSIYCAAYYATKAWIKSEKEKRKW